MAYNDNASMTFVWSPHTGNDVSLSFGCDQDITLDEFKDMCKKFAFTLGFGYELVKEYFGED